jgi:hypothetical protein
VLATLFTQEGSSLTYWLGVDSRFKAPEATCSWLELGTTLRIWAGAAGASAAGWTAAGLGVGSLGKWNSVFGHCGS